MSSIKLESNASGTGIFTIASPNSNTNRTLTLPDSSGTLALAGSSLTGVTESASPFETALGTGAGVVNTGVNNTFIGYEAGNDNTTGANNTAVGYQALDVNTTGQKNTAVGATALGANTTGTDSVAVGWESLRLATTAQYNVGVGPQTLYSNTTGSRNTAVGSQALLSNTTGTDNIAVGSLDGGGYGPLWSNTTGRYNVGIGGGALGRNTTASNNTAIGYNSLNLNTTGGDNTAVGYGSLDSNLDGIENVAVGAYALGSNTTNGGSVAIGWSCLTTATGAGNTAVGKATGYEVTTGANNLLLGKDAGRSTAPSGTITTGSNIVCLGDNNITTLYCKTSTINTSDIRDKTDIQDFSHGLDWITQLRPVTYRWDMRSAYENGQRDGSKKESRLNLGFIAQEEIEIEKQFGYANDRDDMIVSNINEDGSTYGMNYTALVPILVNSIKQLKAEVDSLKTQLATPPAEPNA
jgi:hypothetical protein